MHTQNGRQMSATRPAQHPGVHIWRIGFLVLVLALALYLWTLDNGIATYELEGGDLITHQYAQVQARFSNAPGYPLYTMGGWVWFHVLRPLLGNVANPIQILSSYSTLWAIVALALLYILLIEVTQRNPYISALITLTYGVTYFFWYYAVTTEQYTSAVAHTLAIILVLFRWEKAVHRKDREKADRLFLLLAFLLGLGLAHMVTVLLIGPPVLWFVWRTDPDFWKRKRLLGKAIVLGALPLLAYIYVYVRGAQHPEWRGQGSWPNTFSWFLYFLSTPQGRAEMTWTLGPFTDLYPSLIWKELTLPVLIVGLGGIALLGKRRSIVFYATLVLYFIFCYIDRLGNWYQVIMPAYPLIFIGVALVAQRVWSWAERYPRPIRQAIHGIVILILALVLINRFVVNYPRADQSNKPTDTGLNPGWRLLADEPAPHAAIFGVVEEKLALDYITIIWGYRPDVKAVDLEEAKAILASGERPLYVSIQAAPFFFENIGRIVDVRSGGLYVLRVGDLKPQYTLPDDAIPLDIYFGNQVKLVGYRLSSPPKDIPISLPLRLTLYWEALSKQDVDWSVSVRPTRNGQFIYLDGSLVQSDHAHPAHGYRPTSSWQPREIVRDDYPVPSDPRLKFDGITVVLYRALGQGRFENLGIANFTVK